MGLSEADTRAKLIDPRLRDAGWAEPLIQREYPYKRGRVRLLGDQPVRDEPQFVDYLLRQAPNGLILAVVEAKDEDHSPGAGLQQAIAYATDLGVSFAFASNGHGIVEQDLLAGTTAELEAFPSPEELTARYEAKAAMRGPIVTNRVGESVRNPMIEPVYASPTGRRLRYYQEAAVSAAIDEVLAGKHRALLALATGTGKTFIANNIVWKLVKSGYFKKTLFLVDRLSLWRQAYNDFAAFGDARGLVKSGEVPIQRDIHFATYQTLYLEADGDHLFKKYPADYFDLVVIDECHRSGYGDWSAILDYFGIAFHLGMTATPKRTDSIDTYEFFASENRDASGEPKPAYEYSLGRGIDDGFLATYLVHRIRTNLDAEGLDIQDEVAKGAELFVPEEVDVRDTYRSGQFEREIVIPDRTRALCEHLAAKLRSWGINDKTIVFCVTVEHAEQVRRELQNLLGPDAGKNLYAARIVSEERDADQLLELFRQSEAAEPVVATTVDLLTTGVDVPAVKNIVFMKPVGSPTMFKQIVGRGSRIDDATGKLFFRVVDYTGATRLFDSWDVPEIGYDGPLEGDCAVFGRVEDFETGDPVHDAVVSVLVGRNERRSILTDGSGWFNAPGLPPTTVTVLVGAKGYVRRRLKTQTAVPDLAQELLVKLRTEQAATERVRISGVTVNIADETVLTLDEKGEELTVSEYLDLAGEQVRTLAGDVVTLAELWRDPSKRNTFREQLAARNIDPAVLALVCGRPDADEYDLLANAAFGARIRTREERARRLEQLDQEFLIRYDESQREVVSELLDKYRAAGVEEIATANVFQVPPFLDEFGGVAGLARLFGGAAGVADLLTAIQAHLYPSEEAA